MLGSFLDIAISIAAFVVAVVTLLPLWHTHRWWVRAWDFPRAQIAIFAALLLVAAWFFADVVRWPVLIGIGACLIYQCARILPFTPLFRREMAEVPRRDGGSQVSLVSANVEMGNDRHDLVAALIEESDADLVFLMETDETWGEALAPALARYPTVITELRDNCYGLIFATRLTTRHVEVVYLTPDDTPTVFAELETPDGTPFRLVGLHPRPPVPGNSTSDRDAEILYSARFAHKADMPVISMGDFNDAAWSDSSRRFKKVGEYLDPRVGRGMVASFHAKSRILRAPIDQFFVTPDVAVVHFYRGDPVGSDHFPMIARVDLDAELARKANRVPKGMSEAQIEETERIFEDYRLKLGSRPRRSD